MASQGVKKDLELMQLEIQDAYNRLDIWEEMNGVNLADYYPTQYEAVKSVPNTVITKNKYGDVIGVDMEIMTPKEFNPPAVIDSNVPNTMYTGGGGNYGGSGYKMNGSAGGTSPHVFSSGAKSVSTGTKVLTAAGTALNTVFAAALGAKLGKAINSSFGGQYAWKEEDWEKWVSEKDSLDQAVFRYLFDIDGNTYVPEEMLASMYKMLDEMGAYSEPASYVDKGQTAGFGTENGDLSYRPLQFTTRSDAVASAKSSRGVELFYKFTGNNTPKNTKFTSVTIGTKHYLLITSTVSLVSSVSDIIELEANGDVWGSIGTASSSYTYNGQTVYYRYADVAGNRTDFSCPFTSESSLTLDYTSLLKEVAWLTQFGEHTDVLPVEGIENEPLDRASTQIDPNVITGTTPETILPQLKQNYPQLFDGSISEDVPQEDGTTKNITYIPVPWPTINSDGMPITGTPSQNDPQVDPDTASDETIKDLIDTLTDFFTNPPTTGTGGSPAVVVPAGSASSLWKIYNPTQAQVDAFGAWLWSSNFVEQIKKLFNDPMQAIIGIHKVFATPSIGGTATIKVGYLDSGVSSDYIDDQYTTIDCGTVNLRECFGNVFDYAPYTRVSLYLPFIGIVDLDVADVMRASINIVYHVDVLTGACLADVKVIRDACGGVLYQYSGSAIVTYPVSSGNYMGMVAGVLSVASGIAGTVLSGGALAPALIGGAVGASHLHTDVSHSGGFSGCAGAMGGKIPYIIVSRPQPALAGNFERFTGLPANAHVTLANCSGMTRVKSVYVKSIQRATDEEKDMIESQLKAGVLV